MSHYFIEDPRVSSDPRVINYTFNGRTFTFTTDAGVFSHGRMDYATDLLLRHIPPLTGSSLVGTPQNDLSQTSAPLTGTPLTDTPLTGTLLTGTPLTGTLLDMGCGYGCMGIVLAAAYGLRLTLADVNPAALRLAAKNCADNRVEAQIIQSDGFAQVEGAFETIVINPPIHAGKRVVYAMYEAARAHLTANGRLYIVIQKKHGAESTLTLLRSLYARCEILYKKKGYYVIVLSVL